jgi:hypothetical protein
MSADTALLGRGVERGERVVRYASIETDRVPSPMTPGLWRRFFSVDDLTGAHTKALHIPAGTAFDEKSHFCDSDHEIFMFEGGFDFDEHLPLREGDYLYRPAGTVYGNREHTDMGGIQIISFGREKVSFHLDDPPKPWPGHYLVDRVWSDRPVGPMHVAAGSVPWQPSSLGEGIEEQRLRGTPGHRSDIWGASRHSPWAADAAFLLKIPAGYRGQSPAWPETIVETLVLSGRGTVGDDEWSRGVYSIGVGGRTMDVSDTLTLYGRSFALL